MTSMSARFPAPRAAGILLRWLQRPRSEERIHGVDLDSMTEAHLERLYAGLVRPAAPPGDESARKSCGAWRVVSAYERCRAPAPPGRLPSFAGDPRRGGARSCGSGGRRVAHER